MKTYILILVIAVHCSLFTMKRRSEDTCNFNFALMSLPTEIKEKIFCEFFLAEGNPLSRAARIEQVCKQLQNLVLNDKNIIANLIKNARYANEDFFLRCKAYHNGEIAFTECNFDFIDTSLFDVRYKHPTQPNGYQYIMSYIIATSTRYIIAKVITKEGAILTKESIRCIIQTDGHACKSTSLQPGCCRLLNIRGNIMDCVIKNRPDMVLRYKHYFFKTIVNDRFVNTCMLKMILPYLEISKPCNSYYYLYYMVQMQKKLLKINSTLESSTQEAMHNANDAKLSLYLALFIYEGANPLIPVENVDGEIVPLAATLIKEIDGSFFPRMKQLLESSLHTKKSIN